MSNINIPDFNGYYDFQNWVAQLPEKEIQSWKVDDWNAMFDKLTAYVEKSPSIKMTRIIREILLKIYVMTPHQQLR